MCSGQSKYQFYLIYAVDVCPLGQGGLHGLGFAALGGPQQMSVRGGGHGSGRLGSGTQAADAEMVHRNIPDLKYSTDA